MYAVGVDDLSRELRKSCQVPNLASFSTRVYMCKNFRGQSVFRAPLQSVLAFQKNLKLSRKRSLFIYLFIDESSDVFLILEEHGLF